MGYWSKTRMPSVCVLTVIHQFRNALAAFWLVDAFMMAKPSGPRHEPLLLLAEPGISAMRIWPSTALEVWDESIEAAIVPSQFVLMAILPVYRSLFTSVSVCVSEPGAA